MKNLLAGLVILGSLSAVAGTCSIEISDDLQIYPDGSQGAYQVSAKAQKDNETEMLLELENALDKVKCNELDGNYVVTEISMFCIQDNYPGTAKIDSGEGCNTASGQVHMIKDNGEELVISREDDSFLSMTFNKYALPKRAYENALKQIKKL